MIPQEVKWIQDTTFEAMQAQAIWPEMQACEAALESNYGQSALAREANNLFGMKQKIHPQHGTLVLPTHEYLDGNWVQIDADWVKYDSVAECFEDRMDTLHQLAPKYPHYATALAAADPYTFVVQVSLTWSTDPNRAAEVQAIYKDFIATDVPAKGSNRENVQDAANED